MNNTELKIIFIFSVLFFCGLCFTYTQNTLSYRNQINEAEMAICDSNYHKAIIHYSNAFKKKDYSEAKDLHNAVVCNILEKNFNRAVILSLKLIEYGADSTFFNNNDYFKPMIKSKYWLKKVIKTNAFYKKRMNKVDTLLRLELIRRYVNDQDINNPKRREMIEENTFWFKEQLIKKAFPSQQKVGISINENRIANNLYEVMLVHYFDNLKPKSKDKATFDSLGISNLLYDLISVQALNPHYFASLNNVGPYYNLTPSSKQYYYVAGDSVFIPSPDTKRLEIINQERLKLGMHTVENYMKLIKSNKFDKRFYLTSGTCIGIFPDFMAEQFQRMGFKNIGNKKKVLNID